MGKSKAAEDFEYRLEEVQQILDAHTALVKFRNARSAIDAAGSDLKGVLQAVSTMFQDPGRGRPPQVHALNAAGIALLSAHLQGYIRDAFCQAAGALVGGRVENLEALTAAANTRANPSDVGITNLFKSIGFPDVLAGLSWNKMSNSALRKKLQEFNTLRNRIVHGRSETVVKAALENYYNSWRMFGSRFDEHLAAKIAKRTGAAPW